MSRLDLRKRFYPLCVMGICRVSSSASGCLCALTTFVVLARCAFAVDGVALICSEAKVWDNHQHGFLSAVKGPNLADRDPNEFSGQAF